MGVFESQRYLNLETNVFAHRDADAILSRMMGLLSDSSLDLLNTCADTLEYVDTWLRCVQTRGVLEALSGTTERRQALEAHTIVTNTLKGVLEAFVVYCHPYICICTMKFIALAIHSYPVVLIVVLRSLG